MQFIFIILFIDIDYSDLYLFLVYKPLSTYALKGIIYGYFTIPANFIILIVLEIISYLCVLWGKDNSVLLLFLGMDSIREKDQPYLYLSFQ